MQKKTFPYCYVSEKETLCILYQGWEGVDQLLLLLPCVVHSRVQWEYEAIGPGSFLSLGFCFPSAIVEPEAGLIFVAQEWISSVLAGLQAAGQLCYVFKHPKVDNPIVIFQRPGESKRGKLFVCFKPVLFWACAYRQCSWTQVIPFRPTPHLAWDVLPLLRAT